MFAEDGASKWTSAFTLAKHKGIKILMSTFFAIKIWSYKIGDGRTIRDSNGVLGQ